MGMGARLRTGLCVCCVESAVLRALRTGGAWLRKRRRCGRTANAQLLRLGVRGAIRISVQVDAAPDGEYPLVILYSDF